MGVISTSPNQSSGVSPPSPPGRGRSSAQLTYLDNQHCSHLVHRVARSMQRATEPVVSAHLILRPVQCNVSSRQRALYMGLGWVLSVPAITFTINSGSPEPPRSPHSIKMDNHWRTFLLKVGHSILVCQVGTPFTLPLARAGLTLWNLLQEE